MLTRNILAVTLVFGIALTIHLNSSQANGSPQWMTGEVASIVETGESALISLLFPDGELMSIPTAANLLQGIKVGDIVTIQVIEGAARIVRVAESAPEPSPKPEKEKKVQWVTGELISIERGAKSSLLSVKMWDGTVFNVAASNDVMAEIKPGDSVIAKVVDGWAESVSKKGE